MPGLDVAVSVPICELGVAKPRAQTELHPATLPIVMVVAVYEAVMEMPAPSPATARMYIVPEVLVPVTVPTDVVQLRLAFVVEEENMMEPFAS